MSARLRHESRVLLASWMRQTADLEWPMAAERDFMGWASTC